MTDFAERADVKLVRDPGTRIIARDTYLNYLDGQGLRQAAEHDAERIRQAAWREAKAMMERAREQNAAELREAQLEQQIAFVDGAIAYLAQLEHSLIQVVGDAVEQLVGERDPEERIRSLVERMLRGIEQDERIRLKVSPADYPAAEAALADIKAHWPHFSIAPADDVEAGNLHIECSLGVVEASLSEQIAAFRQALVNRFFIPESQPDDG
ncbi:MAG: FliH/SctL family protein [Aquisalimonadaceae bacterium]